MLIRDSGLLFWATL